MDIEKLKRQYGADLYLIEVPGDTPEETLQFVFKKPDRRALGAAAKFAASDPIRAAEVMIETCLCLGDKAALEDIGVFQAVSERFGEINKAREATLVKL
jgi:hypothetical protein